jgi:Domain of unknown function (DUF4136)
VDSGKRFSMGVLFAGILLGGMVLGGCDDNVEVIHDPDIHIAKGMTWAWRPVATPGQKQDESGRPVISRDVIANPAPAPPPPQHLESNLDWNTEANRNQLKDAIEHTLKSKGLVQVNDPATANFLVDYHVAVKTRNATVQTVYPGWGWGWGWGWGPPEVEFQNVRFSEGTFVIDLAQRTPKKLAYRAISRKSLNNKTTISPYQAQEAVNNLLKSLKPQ